MNDHRILVSTLQEKGVPSPVERTLIAPPRCRMGAIRPEERAAVQSRSPVGAKYDTRVNRASAYEMRSGRQRDRPANPPRRAGRHPRRFPATVKVVSLESNPD